MIDHLTDLVNITLKHLDRTPEVVEYEKFVNHFLNQRLKEEQFAEKLAGAIARNLPLRIDAEGHVVVMGANE